MGVNVSFRDVDEHAFREFKAAVARAGLNAGEAISEAIRLYVDRYKKKSQKQSLVLWKPHDWGPGTENDSARVDEFVYGWKH